LANGGHDASTHDGGAGCRLRCFCYGQVSRESGICQERMLLK
jgi:hypothetical protein